MFDPSITVTVRGKEKVFGYHWAVTGDWGLVMTVNKSHIKQLG